MKRLVCAAAAICVLMPAVVMAYPGETGFMKTSRKYNERENYAVVCHDEFGIHAQVAEWNDVKDLIRRSPYMLEFIEDTGLSQKKDSALLYFRGEKWGANGEAYYVQMRNHEKSKRFDGIVDQIGDHLFELKVRNNNAKPILCYIPPQHRGHGHHNDDRLPPPPPPPPPQVHLEVVPTPHPVVIHEEHTAVGMAQAEVAAAQARVDQAQAQVNTPRREPRLLSTTRAFREYHFLNNECRAEFGPAARVADWDDIRRLVRTPRDLEEFLRSNDINRQSRDRLMYFSGGYKDGRDRHYYLIYNQKGQTPSGVFPLDSMHGNRLIAATMMHLRTRVLCWVP